MQSHETQNRMTERVMEWCEKVDSIELGDETALPNILKSTSTDLLMAVYSHYADLLEDFQKLGMDQAPWGEWDDQVLAAVRGELRARGLVVLPRDPLFDGLDELGRDKS